MVRARFRNAFLFVVAGAAAASTPADAGAGAPSPAGASSPPLSPTGVLAQLSTHTGGVSIGAGFNQDQPPENDRSLAPYLTVIGEGHDGHELVPLQATTATVDIAGVIAHVQVKQQFQNTGRAPIEAVYVFPASTRAAVHAVRMTIGARTIEARIDRRQAARETYEAARSQGKRAALLEQERANVFTMNVANIMPGDQIGVTLDYSEMLVPEDAVYELVYPTVVGPRYTGGADPVKDRWMANPHLPAGTPEPYRFDIHVHLDTAIPIRDLSSPSHSIAVDYASASRADVRLAAAGGGNRDFVLRYRLAGDKIQTGVLLWEGEGGGGRRENFFALMMEPPQRPTAAEIPPREYIFLLDVSGSMHGFPLDTAKELMHKLLERLRPTDYFDVALFSGAAQVLSPNGSMPATKGNIARAIADIDRQSGGGGTELMGGLEMSYRIPKQRAEVSRTVVVVTDGYVGVEAQAFRFIRERLSEANLFAFGIGSGVNRALIEGMARAGQGQPFVVLRPEKATEAADKMRAYIEQPVLTHVKVSFAGFDATEVAPQQLPDLMARRPLVLFGKYRGTAGGQIVVTGTTGGGARRDVVEVRASDVRPQNEALRWLWARRWVETLDDERAMGAGQPAEDAITTLGLDYHLLTAFTSFVAVDSELVNIGGQGRTVRQPLPLPDGVSNLAVAEAEATGGRASAHRSFFGGVQMKMAPMAAARGSGGMMSLVPPSPASAAPPRADAPMKRRVASADDLLDSAVKSGNGDRQTLAKAVPKAGKRAVADGALDSGAIEGKDDSVGWQITVGRVTAVGDTDALVKALRAALEAGRAGCGGRPGAGKSITLRLTVDRRGHVQLAAVTGADAATAACLHARLRGLTSATAAQGKTPGMVELTIVWR